MLSEHAIVLLDVATRVAERFRTDPTVCKLLDPAVCIVADEGRCGATFLERLEVIGIMSEIATTPGEPMNEFPDSASIAVLVVDQTGATV